MNKLKIISIFLLITTIFTVFSVGCAENKKDGKDSTTKETFVTKENKIYPDLPDVKYDGDDVTILEFDTYGGVLIRDLLVDEDDESRLGGEILKRNSRIEEQYKVNLDISMMELDQLGKAYQDTVFSGDAVYDVIYSRGCELCMYLKAGYCLDLNLLPYCDFSKPWWDAESIKQFSIGDKLFMAESDITLRDKNATACVFFNKAVQDDRNIGDIYSLVGSNDWTWDKMIELAKKATHDNGDNVWNEYDSYGLVADDDLTYMLLHGGGGRFAVKNEDNLPVAGFKDAKTMEVAQAVIDILFDETYFFHLQRRKNTEIQPFEDDRALFFIDALFRGQYFNNMETDFGIMPLPKYNEEQKNYGHSVSIHFSNVLTIPKTCENLERTSVIIEALSADSKYSVLPEFYDVYVKTRNTRDEEAKDMLDLIFSSRVYDLGEFFQFGSFSSTYLRIWSMYKSYRNVSTLYQKFTAKFDNAVDEFINVLDLDGENIQ